MEPGSLRFLVEPLDRSAPFEHVVPWPALTSGSAREAEVERLDVLAAAALVLTAQAVLQDVTESACACSYYSSETKTVPIQDSRYKINYI